jgi:hypothetical protein
MRTATRCLDDLSQAIDHRADGGIIALLFNEVRVALRTQDEAMAKMREELERLSSARTH